MRLLERGLLIDMVQHLHRHYHIKAIGNKRKLKHRALCAAQPQPAIPALLLSAAQHASIRVDAVQRREGITAFPCAESATV